jgi:transposase-like protein
MTQTRRRFPESFKREAVDQVLAGTPLRHVAETLGIAESLLGKAVATICRLRRITWIAGSPRIAPTGIGSRT